MHANMVSSPMARLFNPAHVLAGQRRGGGAIADEAGGAPLRFTNGVDIDQVTREVFFTDSSMNYPRSQHERVIATGRVTQSATSSMTRRQTVSPCCKLASRI